MSLLQSLILGLIQGITEFLPVSSSGHLLLARDIMGISGDYLLLDILLHLATLAAVCTVLHKDIAALVVERSQNEKNGYKFKLSPKFYYLIIASIPAVIVGVLAKLYGGSFFESGEYLCFFFLLTAALLLTAEIVGKKIDLNRQLTSKTALLMGIAQGVAVFPGISRSGSTISAGLFTGTNKNEVARFSFLMSIPIILGSLLVEIALPLIKGEALTANLSPLSLILSMLAALISGYLAIKVTLKIVSNKSFKYLAAYLTLLAVITLIHYHIAPLW